MTSSSSMHVSLTGNSSSLTTHFHPEFELDERHNYSCCLLEFSLHAPIWNVFEVKESNNKFHYSILYMFGGKNGVIELPVGRQNIDQIAEHLKAEMHKLGQKLELTFDKETMKCTIETSKDVCLRITSDSILKLLGFEEQSSCGLTSYVSEGSVDDSVMNTVESVRINCDLISGSFHNGASTHTLHEFHPKPSPPEYKMIEQPKNLIYLPVVKRRINSVNITVVDQNGKPLNVHGTQVNCRIHIKRD